MEDRLSTLLNLSRSIGVDPDPEDGAAWSRIALPPVEAPWPLYANGCIFGAVADEWAPTRSPPRRRRWH